MDTEVDRIAVGKPLVPSEMRDPHVEWLEYGMQAGWIFENPPPLQWHGPAFDMTLEDAVLRVEMLSHFATETEARSVVETLLQSWELDIALTFGHREMTFTFRKAHVVDRDPPPIGSMITGSVSATIGGVHASAALGEVVGEVTLRTYPAVPTNFKADPDVVSMWNRFEGYKSGREPITSMAYFCFTVIKNRFGGTDAACRALSADQAVLRKLTELSTNRGDVSTARKLTQRLIPFTAAEIQWLEAAVRALMRRVGEIACGQSPAKLTMTQLPRL